ncbi:hypothetical protein B0H14DRAFT_2600161 [Mycena olivaceomarginata]|nr:hypothetical protein B0H14DRAFT_2600161 [Mycena olivaceomarginata]
MQGGSSITFNASIKRMTVSTDLESGYFSGDDEDDAGNFRKHTTIPAYLSKDFPLKRVQDHLEKYPSFGWTAEVKLKVLLSRMRTKLTHNRNNIKNLIIASGVRVAPETKLSLDFCVRVALLRAKVKEYPGQDYWTKVDDYLEQLRVKKNNDPERTAEVFGAIYNEDTDMFKVKLGQKEHAALSAVQPEVFGNEETWAQ